MMSRITLHLKRFAHTSTTIDSFDTRWNITRRRSAQNNKHAAARTHEVVSTLRAAPPGWSSVLDSESGGGSESFALESRVGVVQPFEEVEVPGNREPLGTLREVGDEEVAGA